MPHPSANDLYEVASSLNERDGALVRAAADELVERRKAMRDKGVGALRHPFRNADKLDWEHLFKMLPDSGHGQFWKAVLTEAKAALAANQ